MSAGWCEGTCHRSLCLCRALLDGSASKYAPRPCSAAMASVGSGQTEDEKGWAERTLLVTVLKSNMLERKQLKRVTPPLLSHFLCYVSVLLYGVSLHRGLSAFSIQ